MDQSELRFYPSGIDDRMVNTDTVKALHDTVQRVLDQATTPTKILTDARAVKLLGVPDDLAGTLRDIDPQDGHD